MRVRLCMAVAALLLASCTHHTEPIDTRNAVGLRLNASSSWLDPDRKLENEVSITTLNGRDIRQAAYFQPQGGIRQIAVLIRDYSARRTGRPDGQFILLIDPVAGRGELLESARSAVPFSMAFAEDDKWGVICLLKKNTAAASGDWKSVLQTIPPGHSNDQLVLEYSLAPARITRDGTLVCRQLASVQLENGVLAPATDWTAPLIEIQPAGELLEYSGKDWISGNAGGWHMGYSVRHDPADPGISEMSFEILRSATDRQQFRYQLPYHVSYSAIDWSPVFRIAGERHVAAISFLPDAKGKSARPSYDGLFRISVLDTATGDWRVVDDQVERDLGLVVENEVLFYSRREPGKAGRWSVWASDIDGMLKKRLWMVEDTIYVAVVDISGNGKLLIERQYFSEALGMPQLRSELREISLKPLKYVTGKNRDLIVRNIIAGTQIEQQPAESPRPPPIAETGSGLSVPGDQATEGR